MSAATEKARALIGWAREWQGRGQRERALALLALARLALTVGARKRRLQAIREQRAWEAMESHLQRYLDV